jgi:WD40 repeat protein
MIVATASLDSTIRVWNTTTSKFLRTLTGHQNAVLSVDFSADVRRLVSASSDNTLLTWDARGWNE